MRADTGAAMALEPNEVLVQMAQAMAMGSPQSHALGIQLVSVERAQAVMRCPYRPELVGDADTGVIAGGVVTTLLDHTCGAAVMAAMDPIAPAVTLDLRIDYMRAAEPGLDVWARAHCYKLTRSVAFVRATAYDRAREDPVATAQATFTFEAKRADPAGRT